MLTSLSSITVNVNMTMLCTFQNRIVVNRSVFYLISGKDFSRNCGRYGTCFSSSSTAHSGSRDAQPISMTYDHVYVNKESNKSLVIMHGVLGNKKNWRSMINNVIEKIPYSAYLLDARNHGESPHRDEFSYEALAADVCHFIKEHSLKETCLLGHSLGGRAMMTVAMKNPSIVNKLIVVDISPIKVPDGTGKVKEYISQMRQIQMEAAVTYGSARKTVDKRLTSVCPDIFIRNFLMTNISVSDGKFKWIANLDSIEKNFSVIASFSIAKMGKIFEGETHFICGENSEYFIRNEDQGEILQFFPNAKFHTVKGAGHFVHAEQPERFKEILLPILSS